jgi:phage-related protein
LDNLSLRPIVWVGDSRKRIRAFPLEVQKLIGDALQLVQFGGMPLEAKPFKGVGGGVYEIVRRFDADTYRAVYAVQIADEIYVLHAFQKKSKSGIKTPKQDVELIKQRYRQALEEAKYESS